MSKGKDTKSFERMFVDHGVEFTHTTANGDRQADCPFCGKSSAFHLKPSTGQWVCSSHPSVCGKTGNHVTWLSQFTAFVAEITSAADFQKLSKERDGLPPDAFRRQQIGLNPLTGLWLIPSRNDRGSVQDVRRWRKGRKMMGTSGCRANLWGLHRLADPRYKSWPVDLCEGEWDGAALDYLNRRALLKRVVVACPGARVFKDEWVPFFKGRDVVWWYDHDDDGITYSFRRSKKLERVAKSQRFCVWPDDFDDKADVRDFICKHLVRRGMPAKSVVRGLRKFVQNEHPAADTVAVEDGSKPAEKQPRVKRNPSFAETMGEYGKWLKMSPDMVQATRALYSVVLATQWDGDPLWLFLVGAPGSGKTELLMSLAKSQEVFYQSTVKPKALVSGFKVGRGEEDPSLIPQIIGKCLIFKDYTEVLTSNPFAMEDLNGVLRGFYDGVIQQHYGNGVQREYHGHANILAGVTNKIHGRSDATVGERFLKFQLRSLSFKRTQELLQSVIYRPLGDDEKHAALQNAAFQFLDRDVGSIDPEDTIPKPFGIRMGFLAELIAMLRHTVEYDREQGERILKYEPVHEVGTRIAGQLSRFACALCIVDGKRRLDSDSYGLVERVAFNTGIGFNLDIVEALMELGGHDVERLELTAQLRMPSSTLTRRLEDLEQLGIVLPSKSNVHKPGRPPSHFRVSRRVQQLWHGARPATTHLDEARDGRRKERSEAPF